MTSSRRRRRRRGGGGEKKKLKKSNAPLKVLLKILRSLLQKLRFEPSKQLVSWEDGSFSEKKEKHEHKMAAANAMKA